MKYIHSSNHRASFGKYVRKHYKTFINNLNNGSVKPLDTEVISCFVVGCGHSGTTLAAAKLGNHDDAFLIGRETHNYAPAKGLYTSWCVTEEWVSIARSLDKKVFIEKTPKHIHVIRRIRKILPEARFIALTRHPLDNCFSLYKRYGDLDFAIERWNLDNAQLLKWANDRNVIIMSYEQLTTQPESSFKYLCEFLELEWQPSIIDEGITAYDRLQQKRNMEVRQEQVKRRIVANSGKWKEGFSTSQVNDVLRGTRTIAASLGYHEVLD